MQMSYTADSLGPTYAVVPPEWCSLPEASPWSFEEPCFKRPRLGSFGQLFSLPTPSRVGAQDRVASPLRAADWRWLDNLGELPPKRFRSEVAWPSDRSVQRSHASEKCHQAAVGSDCGKRSPSAASSTFEWGVLPALPMEISAAEVARGRSEASMEDVSEMVPRQEQAGARSACTALVPYLRPSAIAASLSTAFLQSGAAWRMLPELRISTSELALRSKVNVVEVMLDDVDELYALVVHESQVALAAYRMGHCPRPVETYDEREPGFRILPVNSSSSSGCSSSCISCNSNGNSSCGHHVGSDMVLGQHRPPTPRPPAPGSHCMDTL